MLLSHAHRFIFVKTRKTAGTSLEISLSRYCGPNDVVTPIDPDDEVLRRELGEKPRNFSTSINPLQWRRAQFGQLRRKQWPRRYLFWNHIRAAEIKELVPDEWDRYLKFTIVRNPWDEFVSRYFWKTSRKTLTIDQLLERFDHSINWKTYSINDEVSVDVVLRYETLEADLKDITDRLSIPFDGWLPRAKANTGRNGVNYREFLEPRHAEAIRRTCAKEIEYWGYDFNAGPG